MTENNRDVPTYIGREKCGCVVAALVDNGAQPEMVSRKLKELTDDGATIELVTVGWVRDHGFQKCAIHDPKNKPPSLFDMQEPGS